MASLPKGVAIHASVEPVSRDQILTRELGQGSPHTYASSPPVQLTTSRIGNHTRIDAQSATRDGCTCISPDGTYQRAWLPISPTAARPIPPLVRRYLHAPPRFIPSSELRYRTPRQSKVETTSSRKDDMFTIFLLHMGGERRTLLDWSMGLPE